MTESYNDDVSIDNVSPFDKRQIERNSKKSINLSGGLKLYVSKNVHDKIQNIIINLNKREDVKTGKKSISGIMLEYIIEKYVDEESKKIEETIEKEDSKTSLENLRANYMDLVIPGRAKSVEIPRLDEYLEYIDKGGIPFSELIKRGKLTDKQVANITLSVEALSTELRRTRDVQHKIGRILKFKKDIKDKIKRNIVGELAEFVYNANSYGARREDPRNMFTFYYKFKHLITDPKRIPEKIPDDILPIVANITGFGGIGDERVETVKKMEETMKLMEKYQRPAAAT